MAIKFKYAASSTTVISLAAALANGANTYSGMPSFTPTTLDNSTDKYPHCRFVLTLPNAFSSSPTAGSVFNLYMTVNDIDGTSDETPVPGATDVVNLARRIGSFVMDNQTTAPRKVLIVHDVLAGVTSADFHIENQCGQSAAYTATPITVKAQPFTYEDV